MRSEILIVFSTTNHLLSRLIRKITKSKVSHCSIWLSFYGVPMVFQASIGGVKPTLLKEWSKHNRVVKKFQPTVDLSDGLQYALGQLNKGFDYIGLLGYIPVMIAKWFKKKIKNPLASPNRLVCSELLLYLDYQDRIPEWNDLEWEETSPQMLLDHCHGPSFVSMS